MVRKTSYLWRSNFVILQREKMDADHKDDNGDQPKKRHNGPQQPKSSIPKDEVKAERKLKKQRKDEKMKLEEMVKLIMQKPPILNNGMFDPIRELVEDAVVHPAKYNLGIQTASIPNNSEQSEAPNLSGAIAQKLKDRLEIDASIALRIQVTAKSVDYWKLRQPHYHIIKRFTLHVIDGDGEKINVKINSSLNSFMEGVQVGTVL
jgi:hypothetical protein